MFVANSLCNYCVHNEGGACRAFREGIPDAILLGAYDHHRPHPGDGGIQFEATDPAAWQASMLRRMMDGEIPEFRWLSELQDAAERAS